MKQNLFYLISNAVFIIFMTACGQTEKSDAFQITEENNSNEQQNSDTTKTQVEKVNEAPELRVIEPTIGFTPDISVNAKKNLDRIKALYIKVDSIISSYPDYEVAKEHLTERQIEIWENKEEYSEEDHLDIGTWGCSWYCGGGPDKIIASSILAPHKTLDYKSDNIHDFSLRTAWVEGVDGYGIGESITFIFPKESPPVTTVQIFNGYMKSDKIWKDNSRVKQLKLYVNDESYALLNLKDIKSQQCFSIDTLQGIKSDLSLRFEITKVYKGDKYDDVAISELVFDGIGVHCFAKGTLVKTPSGDVEIETLKIGDQIVSYNILTKSTEVSIIENLASQKHHNLYELNFSGKKVTVTDDHPFFLDDKYYSVKANNKYGHKTEVLDKGQKIKFLINGKLQNLELTSIKKLDICEMTYTITKLDKNNLFFANGACVATEELTKNSIQ